jgi:hypothetical protein
MSAQALAVLIGPVCVGVAVGSILSNEVAGSSVCMGPNEKDSSCADTSAASAGSTTIDLIAAAELECSAALRVASSKPTGKP